MKPTRQGSSARKKPTASANAPYANLAGNKDKGNRLERRVVRLFQALGKPNVRRSVLLRDKRGNLSEIDVVYGRWWWTVYIECKNYSSHRPVPLQDVAKFKEVLQQNGIPLSRGLFITTSTFSPRARHTGIQCYDGDELRALEKRAAIAKVLRRGVYGVMGAVVLGAIGLVAADHYDWSLPVPIESFDETLRGSKAKTKTPESGRRGWW